MRYVRTKDRTRKKILFCFSCLFLILSLLVIKSTYAKYITSASGDANIDIARWKILVNNQDVVENKELTSVITPIFEGNDNIASNVIAPTAEGYFDIIIDASNTDVSLRYEVTTSDNENSAVADLEISGYTIDDGERQAIVSDDGQIKIENDILYNSTDKDIRLRVYLKWNDDDAMGAVMDNTADTNATKTEGNMAKVNVNLKFIQIPNS